MSIESELKDALANNAVIIGSEQVAKSLKFNNLKSIIIASNCPDKTKEELTHLSKLSDVKIEYYDETGKQLGIVCGKPFGISVLGIKK